LAQKKAEEILEKDYLLLAEEHFLLRQRIIHMFGDRIDDLILN